VLRLLGIHLADLHLGKRLKEFPLLEEQQDILNQVIHYCEENKVDFVILAGDIFDKGIPPTDALDMFDAFLAKLAQLQIEVFALGGNHDSAERLGFLSGFLKHHHIHLITQYKGKVERIALEKAGEKVFFYMLPFVKPTDVRRYLPEEKRAGITSYHEAVKRALQDIELDKAYTNILIAHQFVTTAETCDSEEITVGGLDNIGADILEGFDYVALGHIHGPQSIKGHPNIRYSGTPLKYSFSECEHIKSLTVLNITAGKLEYSTVPFKIMHDLKKLKGLYAEVAGEAMVSLYRDCYVHITLTNEEELLNVLGDMRALYPRLCYLTFENSRTTGSVAPGEVATVKNPFELISSFFKQRSSHELSEVQKQFLLEVLEKGNGEK